MTHEEQEILERGNARLEQIKANGAEKPQRRPRSDKGTHRATAKLRHRSNAI